MAEPVTASAVLIGGSIYAGGAGAVYTVNLAKRCIKNREWPNGKNLKGAAQDTGAFLANSKVFAFGAAAVGWAIGVPVPSKKTPIA
jgi:hypothetical protein